ncbi:MAG: hypothetical protein N2253_09010 [Bacteroidia bacterium]|nr:hypothetical protein [Bacteroidia bacterium]
MPFDWRDFVELAEQLRTGKWQENLKEAVFRSAVSRAYYGAFGTARKHAERYLGFVKSCSSQDHKVLREFFKKRPETAPLSTELDRLRQWRNQCDYDSEVAELEVLVQNAIASAKHIISQVS